MANGAVSATSQQEFSDADFRVVGNADQSKKVAFQVSGLTTATTRVITMPDKDLTIQAQAAVLDALAALANAAGALNNNGSGTLSWVATAQIIAGTMSLADDAASNVSLGFTSGIVIAHCATAAGGILRGVWQITNTPVCLALTSNSSDNGDESTSALTGTTGVDGNMTISYTSGGALYFENRSGGSRTVRYAAIRIT